MNTIDSLGYLRILYFRVKKAVVVSILDQRLNVRSDGDEAYITQVSEYVTEKIREVTERAKNVPTLSVALLACLNIADEFFRYRENKEKSFSKAEKKIGELIDLIEGEAGPVL